MSPIVIPDGYQYVVAAVALVPWLLTYQTSVVSKARKQAKISYPQAYAEVAQAAASPEAMKFNCAQRAHQNTLEYLPVLLITSSIAGLKFPLIAAPLTVLWILGRFLYTVDYSTGDPKKRSRGFYLSTVGIIGLASLSTYNAAKFVMPH